MTISAFSPQGELSFNSSVFIYLFYCSKPFTFALSIDQLGVDVVQDYIGREPSGRYFNEIVLDYNGEEFVKISLNYKKLVTFPYLLSGFLTI